MATMPDDPNTPPTGLAGFFQSALGRNLALGAGIALVVSIMASIWMWNQKPDYRVLVSNFSDRDGGAMIAALQQMNIPYRFAEGGGALLVPADQVHDARLKLAAQGLPKGGNVGFELMENQKLGSSQFLEQVNFQRALEGELARSINSIGVVQSARVHLAIPKPSVFVRERQKPTASVLINLHPGRNLEEQQVSAIVHLVSSSVPELTAQNVTVVDQNGNLLSDTNRKPEKNGLDPTQIKYVIDLQDGIVKRIESILTPIVGNGNVRAEATAEVDFSRVEQAAETYKPNGTPDAATIRSQKSSESRNNDSKVGGLVGAVSNQPGGDQGTQTNTGSSQKDSTTNYEVDKTVRYMQQSLGGIKRLTVAVVVNYKRDVDAEGKATLRPLTDQEKQQITDLVKEAMGYSAERGDSLNVVNSSFAETPAEVLPEEPIWKAFLTVENIKATAQWLVSAGILLYMYFSLLRPMIRKAAGIKPAEEVKKEKEAAEAQAAAAAAKTEDGKPESEQDGTNDAETENAPTDGADTQGEASTDSSSAESGTADGSSATKGDDSPEALKIRTYHENLDVARKLAMQDPKMVAKIVKNWVNGNE